MNTSDFYPSGFEEVPQFHSGRGSVLVLRTVLCTVDCLSVLTLDGLAMLERHSPSLVHQQLAVSSSNSSLSTSVQTFSSFHDLGIELKAQNKVPEYAN